MKITKFEDIIAWKLSKALTVELYTEFKMCRDLSFKDQIQRASVSIMNNISGGFGRNTDKEFKNFLYISNGSCNEVGSLLYLGIELHYISNEKGLYLIDKTNEISKVLTGFIKKLIVN